MQKSSSPPLAAEHDSVRPGPGMWLYAAVWWVSFATFTSLMWVWTCLAYVTVLFDRRARWFHLLSVCVWGWGTYALNPFWSFRVEGREKLPWDGRAILTPNHDGAADIPICAALFRPFRFVSKRAVFRAPVLGWAMRMAKYIPLRRGDRESVLEMLQACRDSLHDEVPVLLFPEGTRSTDGNVRPFKDGPFQLAVETNSPVFPIILAGTRDISVAHRGLIPPFRIKVRVKVLDPVYPHEFDHDMARLRDHVRTVIVAEKGRLNARLRSEDRPKRA